ncbi:hypothetical protein [Moritella viscosa]|uniref:hypothetical protein n=1 Tax=Moritella viscosa TaxID=80854 RepID=UPI0009190EFF|nr:hypothetical protein [Moritella viscosa]SHO16011.1 Putative response regulator receiver domain protein [Moritella viscosa]SHO18859.1 Putative response regulator receiver domain protein [Moritella viscosa]
MDEFHIINNYYNKYDNYYLAMILEIDIDELLEKTFSLSKCNYELDVAIRNYKKSKSKKNAEIVKSENTESKIVAKEFEELFEQSVHISNYSNAVADPDLIEKLTEEIGRVVVANRVYGESLRFVFDEISDDKDKIKKVDKELKALNLSYAHAKYLVEAVTSEDVQSFRKISRRIENDFTSLSMIHDTSNLEQALLSCLKSRKYIIDSHPDFKRVHLSFDFPEIYLIKFAVAKSLK